MFNVFDKSGKEYLVFKVRNDKNGYPVFLIYKDNQWRWKSAKYFKPYIEEENYGCEWFYIR